MKSILPSNPAKPVFLLALCLLLGGQQLLAGLSNTSCQAGFDHIDYNGPLPQAGGKTFANLASGDYTELSWSFGDGTHVSDTSTTVNHFYSESGTYEVCMTIWNNTDCNSMYCTEVAVNLNAGSCVNDDCVYPGDVNGDGVANMYDLIPLGTGFGANGPPRQNASLDFTAQPATDWSQSTAEGINYKHLDCDGNGNISAADVLAIQYNYSAIKDPITIFETDGPELYLDFEFDTIFIDETTPDLIQVKADLILGNDDNQLTDFTGMALALEYDTSFVQANQGVHFEYNENSFIGKTNDAVLPYSLDLRSDKQFDLGIARTDQRFVSGAGRVATVSFIIIGDIIDGRSSGSSGSSVEFAVPISSVKLMNSAGEIIEVSIRKKAASVTFIKDKSTSLNAVLDSKVSIYPNPVNEALNIQLDQLEGEQVEIYDALGRLLERHPLNNKQNILSVEQLAKGIYTLHIYTREGSISKRFVKN